MKSGCTKKMFLFLMFFTFMPLLLSARSFDDLFPGLKESLKVQVFSEGGIIRSLKNGEAFELSPHFSSGIDLYSRIIEKKYTYFTESLLVIPYTGRTLTVLDAYNALGKVRNLKGRLYSSHSRNAEVPLFEDATRLDNAKKTNPIPDPPAASSVPARETIYIRLKDANFGNTFYQADISTVSLGVLYCLSNYKSISYLLFPVMKEGKFTALLYMEALSDGMLVYSIAGTEVSDFIAGKISIPSAISKRLSVFVDWITEGIKKSG
ncbi:MAG: hypothetical protein LBH43_07845 [Treponema sp.]|jgi:hypothetical protein|nr:hypothetical protein [Treponema sp.]